MAMTKIQFSVSLFLDPEDVARSRKALLWLMESLSQINLGWLGAYQSVTPPLYRSGVIYRPESRTEIWQDIPSIRANGFGDCEDLACWRIAEYRLMGVAAVPYIKWRDVPSGERAKIYHAVLRLPDGRIEDPALALGMHGAPYVSQPVYVDPE
jgi:hypothetical protein